ncbi:hypothetical protein [uncultured Psychroserpens sp.]|uniref:hypothetical protein n=1 Tax=uncultured Psychroserpens sp. TaxID=255436 RepID=UPI002603A057|nr:hypothetical protein [uncultured Psychroserpens sp.]
MKSFYFILISLVFISCSNEKTILLPEIENAKITEVHDVSHAYLFYDETKVDKVELNRKNLISTTNWLINVDKRLTLERAIPKIKLLQDKKRNAKMHKNEAAKNYYTCNDTSIKNLGFLEFTNVHYNFDKTNNISTDSIKPFNKKEFIKAISEVKSSLMVTQGPDITQEIILYFEKNELVHNTLYSFDLGQIETYLSTISKIRSTSIFKLILKFNRALSFGDYIKIKSYLNSIESNRISINNNEFIY